MGGKGGGARGSARNFFYKTVKGSKARQSASEKSATLIRPETAVLLSWVYSGITVTLLTN